MQQHADTSPRQQDSQLSQECADSASIVLLLLKNGLTPYCKLESRWKRSTSYSNALSTRPAIYLPWPIKKSSLDITPLEIFVITSECNLVFPNFSLQYFPLESKSDCFLFAQISLLLLLQHLKDIKLPSVSAVVVTKLPWILLRVRSTIALPTSPAIFSHNNSHHRCKQVLGLHFHRRKNQWSEKWQGLQGSHWELPLPQ